MLLINPYLQWNEDRKRRKNVERNGGDIELDQFRSDYEVFNDEKVIFLGRKRLTFVYILCL